MACDHRPTGTDVVDIASAVRIVQIGAIGAIDEYRLAAHAAKSAHRRIDAGGNAKLRARKVRLRSTHGLPSLPKCLIGHCHLLPAPAAKSCAKACAVVRGSRLVDRALMTAIRSAPASISGLALCSVIPPIA